jgi:hypothetical protein
VELSTPAAGCTSWAREVRECGDGLGALRRHPQILTGDGDARVPEKVAQCREVRPRAEQVSCEGVAEAVKGAELRVVEPIHGATLVSRLQHGCSKGPGDTLGDLEIPL